MHCGVVSIFPEMFQALHYGITGRAIKRNLLTLNCINPRDFADDAESSVDDRPYGGGPGMVMKAEPLIAAIAAAKNKLANFGKNIAPSQSQSQSQTISNNACPKVIYLSPQGKVVQQSDIEELLAHGKVVFVAGRYEGIDERVCTVAVDAEWSLGDYVLSGGELAAMTIIDALARLIPGALGDAESNQQESFAAAGLLDWPHYTRPAEVAGAKVPEVLLMGNHAEIYKWRLQQQLGRTWARRPDLLAKKALSVTERALLQEYIDTQFKQVNRRESNE